MRFSVKVPLSLTNEYKPMTKSRARVNEVVVKDTNDAALYIGTTSSNLKLSRHTGLLFGRPAPEFLMAGGKRLYKVSTLNKFVDALESYRTTAEAHVKLFDCEPKDEQ